MISSKAAEQDVVLALMLQSTYDDGSTTADESRDELISLLVVGDETTATTVAPVDA